MAEFFFGPWEITVASKDADFGQRFLIEGSDASDGPYPGETNTPRILVNGTRWSLRFEWSESPGSDWRDSAVRRTSATYSSGEGLLVTLGVDDNLPEMRDGDFNDVVMRCRNLDPALMPWVPLVNPVEFTLPPKGKVRASRRVSRTTGPVGKKRPI
jgi:hypothetical protein